MTERKQDLAAGIEREFGPGVLAMLGESRPNHLTTVDELDLTDSGLAAIVAKAAGDGFRRCNDTSEWRADDGRVWVGGEAAVKQLERTVLNIGRQLYDRAPGLESGLAKRASSFALRARSDAGVRAVMSRLAAVEGLACTSDIFDKGPELLNVANGTIDLRTGELRGHQRADFITRLIDLPYDAEADAERWKRFLQEAFEPHPELVEYVALAIGYAATGLMAEHVFHLLIGLGRNGKSTFVETVAGVLGDYGLAIAADTLARSHDLQRPRPDIALMRGRRFVYSQESNRGTPLDEALIKKLTGGDTISARLLHSNPMNFKSVAKVFMSTNHAPEITGTETAIWRRVRLIPFHVSFAGREDVSLSRKLEAERAGILAWIVRGAGRYLAEGLQAPAVVTAATDEYRKQSDQFGRFLDECVDFIEGANVAAQRLQGAYKAWAANGGEHVQRDTLLAEYLASNGVPKTHTRRGKVYAGISLKPEFSSDENRYA